MVVNRVPPSPKRKVGEFNASCAQGWPDDGEGGEVVAFPRAAVDASRAFGRREKREPFSLIVDLHSEELGARWFRGAATLAALCGVAFFLAPDFKPFIASKVAATSGDRNS